MNMRKIQFDDVTPPNKRSIRNIPIPNNGKRRIPQTTKPFVEPENNISTPPVYVDSPINTHRPSSEFYYPGKSSNTEQPFKKSKKPKVIFITMALVLILGVIGVLMTVFASASVSIVPQTQEVDVDTKVIVAMESSTSTARYEVIKSVASRTTTVEATGESAVEERASGKIIVYNNYSSESQRLVTRTRFESPEGLIYRIQEGVVVPGKTTKDGKVIPGSVEVEVFADEAGEKYNIKKTDLTVPGFKNDSERYKGFYARSVTDMEGGFIGNRKTVATEKKQSALEQLNLELQKEIEKDFGTKVPEGLTIIPGGIIYEQRELPTKDGSSSVELGVEVTAYAILLNSSEISSVVATQYISESEKWQGINPTIEDFSSLNMSVVGNPKIGENLTLHITGKAKLVADVDKDAIKQLLLGKPRKNAANVVDEVPGISKITTVIRPIWKQSFPNNPSKINVKMDSN